MVNFYIRCFLSKTVCKFHILSGEFCKIMVSFHSDIEAAQAARDINNTALYKPLFLPFTYQSSSVSFTQWISLLTPRFSPPVAHIVAGISKPVQLSHHKSLNTPDRIVLYNPTSIVWRYMLVAGRRLRA